MYSTNLSNAALEKKIEEEISTFTPDNFATKQRIVGRVGGLMNESRESRFYTFATPTQEELRNQNPINTIDVFSTRVIISLLKSLPSTYKVSSTQYQANLESSIQKDSCLRSMPITLKTIIDEVFHYIPGKRGVTMSMFLLSKDSAGNSQYYKISLVDKVYFSMQRNSNGRISFTQEHRYVDLTEDVRNKIKEEQEIAAKLNECQVIKQSAPTLVYMPIIKDPVGPINEWPMFYKQTARGAAEAILNMPDAKNVYLLRYSSLFPDGKNDMYVISVTYEVLKQKQIIHALFKILPGNQYKYVDESGNPSGKPIDDKVWYNTQFSSFNNFVNIRYPTVTHYVDIVAATNKLKEIDEENIKFAKEITHWPFFIGSISRDDTEKKLKEYNNVYCVGYSNVPKFTEGKKGVYVLSTTSGSNSKKYTYNLFQKIGNKYWYITENEGVEIGPKSWSDNKFDNFDDMVQARYPGVTPLPVTPENVLGPVNKEIQQKRVSKNIKNAILQSELNDKFYNAQNKQNNNNDEFFNAQGGNRKRTAYKSKSIRYKLRHKKTRKSHNSKKYTKRATKSCKVMRK